MKTGICNIHGALDEKNAYVCISKGKKCGWRLRCKECARISKMKMYNNKREEYIQYSADWAKNNREYINKWKREDRINNPEKKKMSNKRQRELLIERIGIDMVNLKKRLDKFKITIEHYQSLKDTQENRCAICGNFETKKNTRNGDKIAELCIDHDHSTNKIRELLCRNCNTGIGMFKDDVNLVQTALNYLKKHKDKSDAFTST
jgi:hypothetical protein